jgi:drug/metabolite transporter (DMT)-like permease
MPPGVALSLVSYLLYSCCDAIIKGFGSGLTVFEIAFWTALFSLLPVIFTKPKAERWQDFWSMKHPFLVNLRSITGLIGNICIIFAFTTIPLAEAYSIAFLAPIFVVALSRSFLGESVSAYRWAFLFATFVGVLIVVRPGFRELHPGHLTALVAALMGAITTTVLRRVAPHEKRVSLLGIPLGYVVIFNGLIMRHQGIRLPSPEQFGLLMAIGAIGGTSNILFITAARRAKASQIAPGQYSQIIWAVIFGALFFKEFPDSLAFVGLAVVITGGILNVLSDEARVRIFSRLSVFGPASAVSEVSAPLTDEPPAHPINPDRTEPAAAMGK